jgi:hypothetical protein
MLRWEKVMMTERGSFRSKDEPGEVVVLLLVAASTTGNRGRRNIASRDFVSELPRERNVGRSEPRVLLALQSVSQRIASWRTGRNSALRARTFAGAAP